MHFIMPGRVLPVALVCCSLGLVTGGCSGGSSGRDSSSSTRASSANGSAVAGAVAPGTVTSAEAARVHANELGKIMILEYHNIENKSGAYYQPPDQLRKDLQQLYDNGYATMDIHDYVTGNISTPAGKTPVVLTFDDATIGQFRYLPGGESIDPNCAVGILNDFAAAHPGFGHHATFFVLPSGFGQSGLKAAKYRYLVSHGYGIGNHTWTHPIMTHKTPLQVQEELGRDDIDIHAIIPDYRVDILAYPFGSRPKTQGKPDDTYIASGSWQGHPYKISAAFLVGAEPAPSPYSSKLKPYAIPRVQAIEKDLVSWIARFKANPRQKFISDGDPGSVSIPASMASQLNRNAVSDRKVVTY